MVGEPVVGLHKPLCIIFRINIFFKVIFIVISGCLDTKVLMIVEVNNY